MTRRLILLSVLFIIATGYGLQAMRPELVPPREPLSQLPMQLDRWQARNAEPLTKEILDLLGVEDHVNRFYVSGAEPPVSLYIGYYQSQREGDTIHSPMNCLPGAGWQPVDAQHAPVTVPGVATPIVVNRFLIQKGVDQQVVLYWYQSHGRVVASEYWSKLFMVYDAVRLNRSDAALVRVVTPVLPGTGQAVAFQRATEFVQALFPELGRFLPS